MDSLDSEMHDILDKLLDSLSSDSQNQALVSKIVKLAAIHGLDAALASIENYKASFKPSPNKPVTATVLLYLDIISGALKKKAASNKESQPTMPASAQKYGGELLMGTLFWKNNKAVRAPFRCQTFKAGNPKTSFLVHLN